ncbi:MAG: pepsin/retropepsin-like aspartic protease family protein [Pseudomonadota bacterium]
MRRALGVVVATFWIAACASAPQEPPAGVVEAPYRVTEAGLLAVRVLLNDEREAEFVIDTASTLTTLTRSTADALTLEYSEERMTSVYGFFERDERPVTDLRSAAIGGFSRENLRAVVLENVARGRETRNLIGVDFFEGLALEVLAEPQILRIYPPELVGEALGRRWTEIPLGPNPFGGPDRGLLFAEARLDRTAVPALIDTGASFTALSWTAVDSWRIDRILQRLEEDWRAQGAIGEFDPTARVRIDYFEIGKRYWRDVYAYIFELETLAVLGEPDAPIMVAGADLFLGTDFLIDFQNRRLYVRGSRIGPRIGDPAVTVGPPSRID